MASSIEIICVGNELLIGKTTNTNAQWLAKRITTLGLNTKRITIVSDNVDEISTALQEAIHRKPIFLITTGGLGPTFDDKTLEGIAKALGSRLETNSQALKMVREKYSQYVKEGRMERVDLTPARLKMAELPKGGKPLFNPVGTAPGVTVKHNDTTIIALPGVPSEMKAIFEESVAPLLQKVAGNVTFFEASLGVTGIMESAVAPIVDQVMHDNPYVYIKSHPKGEERIPHLELHLSTTAGDASLARKRVSRALIQLSDLIQAKSGKIRIHKAKL